MPLHVILGDFKVMTKILVSDYDGTLYTDERNMRINCRYLKEFIAKGNLFVLSSGRSLDSLMGQIKKYDIPFTHLSCCDGSFLYRGTTLLSARCIGDDAIALFDPLVEQGKHKKVEYSYPECYSSEYFKNQYIGSVALTIDLDKIDDKFNKTFKKIKKNHPEYQFDVYGYNEEIYYLIRPHGVNKAEPIKFLQNDIGITRENVYTVGDNTNDRELISEYNGYRIGNNRDIIDVAVDKYDSVHQLINDINKGKVKKRW